MSKEVRKQDREGRAIDNCGHYQVTTILPGIGNQGWIPQDVWEVFRKPQSCSTWGMLGLCIYSPTGTFSTGACSGDCEPWGYVSRQAWTLLKLLLFFFWLSSCRAKSMGFGATQTSSYMAILSFTRCVTSFAPLGFNFAISQNRNNSLVLPS